MSWTSEGPGWWQASDGRWYPPEQAPSAYPPPAPPAGYSTAPPVGYPTAGPASTPAWMSSTLSGWVQGLFWTFGAVGLIACGMAVLAWNAFKDFEAPSGGLSELKAWVDADDALSGAAGFFSLATLALFVLMIIWSYKAVKASQLLAPGPRQWSAGWAIGAWFIPLANLVLPKLVLGETERIANAPRSQGAVVGDWRRARTSGLGWAWWCTYAGAMVAIGIGRAFGTDWDGDTTSSQVTTHYAFLALGFGLAACAAVCGALFVRRLSSKLDRSSVTPPAQSPYSPPQHPAPQYPAPQHPAP